MTASAFIAGTFVPHFAFGLLLVLGLDSAMDQVKVWMQDMWRRPDTPAILAVPEIGAMIRDTAAPQFLHYALTFVPALTNSTGPAEPAQVIPFPTRKGD